jgi:photosystem II stability/assembly factor-like uncharacterized protein
MNSFALFIGTVKGLFQARYTGSGWDISGPLLKGWDIKDIQLDARREQPRLLAAVNSYVYGGTPYYSDDFGATWQQFDGAPRYQPDSDRVVKSVWTVVPGATDEPDTLRLGVDMGGLFESHDGGTTWTENETLNNHPTREEWVPGAGGMCLHTILQNPENLDQLMIAISAVSVFRSDDRGKTWEMKNEGVPKVLEAEVHKSLCYCPHCLRLSPTDPQTIYRQDHKGIFVSKNAGDTWEDIEKDPIQSGFGFPIGALQRDDGNPYIYVIPLESDEYRFTIDGAVRVFRSADDGDSWETLTAGLPQDNAWETILRNSMDTGPAGTQGVFFGTTSGRVFGSLNAGDSWEELPCILPRVQCVRALSV